jgi:glycosyltransferase involved in cell wall biosynthesis
VTTGRYRIAVVMPVYNEREGIEAFLRRIDLGSIDDSVLIVCVDDASQDSSAARIEGIRDSRHPIVLVRQGKNQGHGPTTVRGWSEALDTGAEWILTTDSDGHIHADSLRELVRVAVSTGCDVVEGRRGAHSQSVYRRLVSGLLPVLVGVRTRSWCPDANTPYRVYRRTALERLRAVVPPNSRIPNLWASVLARRIPVDVTSVKVQSDERHIRGSDGSSWAGSSRGSTGSIARFAAFCHSALVEWRREWSAVRRAIRTLD